MLSATADQWDLHVGGDDDDDLSICGQTQHGVSVEYCSPTLIIICRQGGVGEGSYQRQCKSVGWVAQIRA